MKKILALAGSNSKKSINQKLVNYVVSRLGNQYQIKSLVLTDYNIPMYNIDHEIERGIPVDVQVLKNIISDHEALIISVNEHNGSISSFFKNAIDWLSRADRNFLAGKKILLMSTSSGKRGASSALEYAKNTLPRFGAHIVESFSFPSFNDNFDEAHNQVTNELLELGLSEVLSNFERQVNLQEKA